MSVRIYLLTFLSLFKNSIKNSLVIVVFHEVSDNPSRFHVNNNLNVTKQNFYNQLSFLKNKSWVGNQNIKYIIIL